MPWWAQELCSSIRFLRIRGSHGFWWSKRVYEIALPGAVSIFSLIVFICWESVFSVRFIEKIASNTFQFLVFAVPFHLAALGAFATFERPVLDESLKGTNAELRVWSNEDNRFFYKDLTLRQYVSLLFGYLCTLGIIFIALYIVMSAIDIDSHNIFMNFYIRALSIFVLSFFLSHYVFLSIYAITFLFDKVNKVSAP